MVKALTTLLNNGKVQDPHLLYSMKQGNHVERYQQTANLPQVGDPKSPYWGIVRNGMYGMANQPNGTGYKLFHTAPYQIAAKSGTSQVFSLKQNQTYNAKMIPVRLRDHIFYTLFAPYQHPKVAMALILENGGGDGVVAGPTARAILDHIFLSRSRHLRRQPMCRSVTAPMPSKRQDLFRRRIVHSNWLFVPSSSRRHSVLREHDPERGGKVTRKPITAGPDRHAADGHSPGAWRSAALVSHAAGAVADAAHHGAGV
ncbi:cell elongation, e phase; peptidoglycan synthetase; penicillin-binding protein 2 [Klebsiella pneumoniae]|uniref:Cell elongation, e phase peptidoglycan synthetase penicillin-binding protein 2 n=1 Tax=Klebsiella pneumoniae TaxID=573 RepID=A0A2X3DUJ4_KLEPN|nr:cell elongation, e phase; peptidoglycan synthetase; penicillin-binding protein 2 [Klebsiella pneumoniae]